MLKLEIDKYNEISQEFWLNRTQDKREAHHSEKTKEHWGLFGKKSQLATLIELTSNRSAGQNPIANSEQSNQEQH